MWLFCKRQVQDIQWSLKELTEFVLKIDFLTLLKSTTAQNQDHNKAVIEITQKVNLIEKAILNQMHLVKKEIMKDLKEKFNNW